MVVPSNEALPFGELDRVGLWCSWSINSYLFRAYHVGMHITMISRNIYVARDE